nr:MAG TPA: hypothetical protein [Caudoviricetes sp.]
MYFCKPQLIGNKKHVDAEDILSSAVSVLMFL